MSEVEFRLRDRVLSGVSVDFHPARASAGLPPGIVRLRGSILYRDSDGRARALRSGVHLTAISRGPMAAGASDEPLVDALRALAEGEERRARKHLRRAPRSADAAFLSGCLALNAGELRLAETELEEALRGGARLGRALMRRGLGVTAWLPVRGGLVVRLRPERCTVLIALAELRRARGEDAEACSALRDAARLAAGDPAVGLLLADAVLAVSPDAATARRIMALTEGVSPRGAVSTLQLLYRARALRVLGRAGRARDLCLRARARASQETAIALRLERAASCTDLRDYETASLELRELERRAPGAAARATRNGLSLGVDA